MSKTRRIRVTHTETLLVDVPAEEAEHLLLVVCDYQSRPHPLNEDDRPCRNPRPGYDTTDASEAAARWRRQARHSHEFIEGGIEIEAADGEDPWYSSVLDVASAREGYLWSAWHFLGKCRQELSSGRYREGHCPDLDRLNTALGRLEEELRLMALADDPKTAKFAEQERARA